MIYLFVFVLLIVLSYHYDIRGNSKNKDFWYLLIQVILILIAGLRYRVGSDTQQYIYNFYHVYPTFAEFSFEDYPIGKDPLYVIMNSIVKSLGGKFFWVQLIQSTFVIELIFKYFKKHSAFIFTCSLFYFFLSYTYFNMEIMRASMSIVVSLYANDYLLKKKWLKAYLLYCVAIMFHVQSIMLLLMPLTLLLKLNLRSILFVFSGLIIGYVMQMAFGDFIDLLSFSESMSKKAGWYSKQDFYNTSFGNINYFIVFILPLIVYSFWSLFYLDNHCKGGGIQKFQSFVILGLFFLFVQINFQIAFRYVDYFVVYMIIFISELTVCSSHNRKGIYSSDGLLRTIIILIPFFIVTSWRHYRDNYYRFIPYYSIFERNINKEREQIANDVFLQASPNEY